MLKRATFLSISALLVSSCAFLVSCATTDHIKIGEPDCDRPMPVNEEVWNDIILLREAMSHNQLVDEKCIELLRNRIRLHDADR